MMAVIAAENRRLLSRRITRNFPLGLGLLMIVGIVIAIIATDDNDTLDFVNDIASGVYGIPGDNSTLVLGPMGFLIPIMAFVIGASYFGADQKAGMIEQLLTWEPRRSRLLLGRLAAGMMSIFVIAALLSAFLVVLLYILASVVGTTDGAFDIWPMVLGAVVRSGIVGAIFFAMGLGATVITNNSVASIVGFLIYAFVIETALLQPLLPKVANWLPLLNADAFVSRNGVGQGGFFGEINIENDILPEFHHGWLTAGVLVAVWAFAIFGVGLALFNQRDVD